MLQSDSTTVYSVTEVVGFHTHNTGSTTTAWNRVAAVAKDSSGRVVFCGSRGINGQTNRSVPGYGVTNVLVPGETGYTNAWEIKLVNVASIATLSTWPQWKE